MKKDTQEDWKVEQREHQMHANQKWVICPCVLFILTPRPDARRIKTPIYLLTLPIVFLSFGCFADNSHAGQRGCSYHLLCRCLCLLQCNLPSLYPLHNTPVQTCRIFWQFLTICEHMLGWPVKSANLRVESVQHCHMFFSFFLLPPIPCSLYCLWSHSRFVKLRFGVPGCADGAFWICNLVALYHKHGCTDCAPAMPKIFNMKS